MADELRKAVVTTDAPTPQFAYLQGIVAAGLGGYQVMADAIVALRGS